MFGTPDEQAEIRLVALKNIKKTLIEELKQLDPQTVLQINGHVSLSIVTQ
jgi:hypothetical protein